MLVLRVYKRHSLRVGSAVELAQAGASVAEMQIGIGEKVHTCLHIMQNRSWQNGWQLRR